MNSIIISLVFSFLVSLTVSAGWGYMIISKIRKEEEEEDFKKKN